MLTVNGHLEGIDFFMTQHVAIAIIGAGPAGIGFGAALKSYGFRDFVILEKGQVADSFRHWNPATRFISPSFTTNGFGFPDLNAVTPETSPAYTLGAEHLSGYDYAYYLQKVARLKALPVLSKTAVESIRVLADQHYELQLANHAALIADFVLIAIGDYAYPFIPDVPGAAYGVHYAAIKNYQRFKAGQEQVIIGGNESAFDLAVNLAKKNIVSDLFATNSAFRSNDPDPSRRLSTYTYERYMAHADLINLAVGKTVLAIKHDRDGDDYVILFRDGTITKTHNQPIFATGFASAQSPLVKKLFVIQGNRPVLDLHDESTVAANVFMLGPQVQHGSVNLCYIYKYRQRFAPLAETILHRIGIEINPQVTAMYRRAGMYLQDFGQCHINCDG